MNLETERLINGQKNITNAIIPRKLKVSQEYYALAVLKYLFPEEYKTLVRKEEDRPDLKDKAETYGVEVTTADSYIDIEDNRIFSQYNAKKDNGHKKSKIENHGKTIIRHNGINVLSHGGGYVVDGDNQLLVKSICNKTDSAQKYMSKYEYLDLVVIKNEIVPHIWENEIFKCIDKAIRQNEKVFRKIFLLYRNHCYYMSFDRKYDTLEIENYERLHLLARLTAENLIKEDDIEWED